MATADLTEPLKDGTIVRVLDSNFKRALIVEYRGALGPKGARVYRIMVVKKPRMYMEVLEEQLEVLREPRPNPSDTV